MTLLYFVMDIFIKKEPDIKFYHIVRCESMKTSTVGNVWIKKCTETIFFQP